MNILIPTQYYSDSRFGGEARLVWDTSNALAGLGTNVFVVTAHLDTLVLKPHPRITIYTVPFGKETTNLDPSTMMKIYLYSLPLLIFKKIDLIYFPVLQTSSPFSVFRFGRMLVETVVETWDYSIQEYCDELMLDRKLKFAEGGIKAIKKTIPEKIFDKLTVWFYGLCGLNREYPKNVDVFICRTQPLLEHLKNKLGNAKLYNFPSAGVNLKQFRPGGEIIKRDPQKTIFLFAGAISHRKGIFYLAEAFNRLSARYPQVQLWIVGQGAPETVRELKKKIAPHADVQWKGLAPLRDHHRYVGAADVYINVSLVSKFVPIETSVMEAMACAKPVIVHKRFSYEEMAPETGIVLVEPKNVDELYAAMEKLLLDSDLRRNIGQNSRRYLERYHDIRIVVAHIVRIFCELLSPVDIFS